MKILITGMNSLQSTENYYLRQELNVVPTQYSLLACLRDMGHEVEQRQVIVGENLDHYDKVIAFIHNPAGFAGYLYNGLWAIYARPDCILSIDDWQADSIWKGLTDLTEETLFRPYLRDRAPLIPDNVEDYAPQLLEALDTVRAMKNKMLIAAFQGGDISKMVPWYPKELVYTYHLNPYHLNRTPANGFTGEDDGLLVDDMTIRPDQKQREWAFVSLVQGRTRKYLSKLELSWPVNCFGGMRGEFKSPRLKEPEMCSAYQDHWGCLVPQYYHAGSGFWRPRVFQVVDAGSILVVHPDEGAVYGPSFIVTPHEVEALDLDGLIDLAKRQRADLYRTQPLDQFITRKELGAVLV